MSPPARNGTRNEISPQEIRNALAPFSISLEEGQIVQIREYLSLLLRWNRTVSLTTITDPSEIVARHFGESMFLSTLTPVENCRLADVGTGAGFPGLALKIASPGIHLTLIESNKRKSAFLSEVCRALGLTGVQIAAERFEEIRPEALKASLIAARAVGEFKQLLRWSKDALASRGHIALWVGSEDATRIARDSGWVWLPPAKIPESQRRFILIGRPLEKFD